MASLTHLSALHLPTARHAAQPPRRSLLRRAAGAVGRLYADRPLVAAVRDGDRDGLPGRPYADLAVLPRR